MRQAIEKHGMFFSESESKGLWNFSLNQQATPEQSGDLLNHRRIGQTFIFGRYTRSIGGDIAGHSSMSFLGLVGCVEHMHQLL